MSINLQDVSIILTNHADDDSRLKSIEMFFKYIDINTVDDLNNITKVFLDKTKIFNFLYTHNKLTHVQAEHLQFLGFVTDAKILNEKTEMNTLKSIISISPSMIIDVLNFIKGSNKSDDQKIELVQTVVTTTDIFEKLIESAGADEISKVMSIYFTDYENYVKCCALLNIPEEICSKYKETIYLDNDTITFFGTEKLYFSKMARGKWYSFEKKLDDTFIIYNIKKMTPKNKSFAEVEGTLSVEKNITNMQRDSIINCKYIENIKFNHKGCIADEHSLFTDAK